MKKFITSNEIWESDTRLRTILPHIIVITIIKREIKPTAAYFLNLELKLNSRIQTAVKPDKKNNPYK